jgi:ribonuclease P protein component
MSQSPPPQRSERLRSRGDFSEVMRNGRRARHRVLHLVALHTGAPSTRVGLSVGRQVGGAVVRNRLKRRLRMIVHGLNWRPGFDVVVLARPGAESETLEEISSVLATSAEKLRLLDTSDHRAQR